MPTRDSSEKKTKKYVKPAEIIASILIVIRHIAHCDAFGYFVHQYFGHFYISHRPPYGDLRFETEEKKRNKNRRRNEMIDEQLITIDDQLFISNLIRFLSSCIFIEFELINFHRTHHTHTRTETLMKTFVQRLRRHWGAERKCDIRRHHIANTVHGRMGNESEGSGDGYNEVWKTNPKIRHEHKLGNHPTFSVFRLFAIFLSRSSTFPSTSSSSPSSSLFEATRQIVHIINFVFWIIFIHSTCHEHWNWLKSIHPPHTHRHIATGNPSTNERTERTKLSYGSCRTFEWKREKENDRRWSRSNLFYCFADNLSWVVSH